MFFCKISDLKIVFSILRGFHINIKINSGNKPSFQIIPDKRSELKKKEGKIIIVICFQMRFHEFFIKKKSQKSILRLTCHELQRQEIFDKNPHSTLHDHPKL